VSAAQRGGGRLVIKGSDTLLPIAQPWAQAFSRQKPGADVSVTGGGSSTGITALINGTCDIANSSRKIRPGEIRNAKSRNVIIREFPVARDGLTIVVHPSNPVKSLSVDQVAAIYTGRVNNWSELGGPNLRIVTNGRDTSSGTYGFFQEDVLRNAKYRADMISTPSNNAIANNVANDRGGIGYIGVAYATEFVKAGKVKEVPISFTRGGRGAPPDRGERQVREVPDLALPVQLRGRDAAGPGRRLPAVHPQSRRPGHRRKGRLLLDHPVKRGGLPAMTRRMLRRRVVAPTDEPPRRHGDPNHQPPAACQGSPRPAEPPQPSGRAPDQRLDHLLRDDLDHLRDPDLRLRFSGSVAAFSEAPGLRDGRRRPVRRGRARSAGG
jgi:hypothetical protein